MSQVLSVHQCARQVLVFLVVERAACCCPPQATLEGLRGTAQSTKWPRQPAVHLLDLILVFLMSFGVHSSVCKMKIWGLKLLLCCFCPHLSAQTIFCRKHSCWKGNLCNGMAPA